MRLVIEYTEGDGYTYCCTNTHPIEYESPEQLLVDLEQACLDFLAKERERTESCPELPAHKQSKEEYYAKLFEWSEKYPFVDPEISLNGCVLYLNNFIQGDLFVQPSIYTIDEWFAKNDQ